MRVVNFDFKQVGSRGDGVGDIETECAVSSDMLSHRLAVDLGACYLIGSFKMQVYLIGLRRLGDIYGLDISAGSAIISWYLICGIHIVPGVRDVNYCLLRPVSMMESPCFVDSALNPLSEGCGRDQQKACKNEF